MNLTLPTRRNLLLEMARWSARRYARCEAHHFRLAVRPGSDPVRREIWAFFCRDAFASLVDDHDELVGLGLGDTARGIVEGAAHLARKARLAIVEDLGLPRSLVASVAPVALAVEREEVRRP